jgi:hypothetical protein
MSGVEKSTGGTDEPRDSEGGAVPESAAVDEGSAADPAQRDRVPPLPDRASAAGDMSLDLAASLDEPEQLVRMLGFAANEHVGYSENSAKWSIVLKHSLAAGRELEQMNAPASRRGAKASPS